LAVVALGAAGALAAADSVAQWEFDGALDDGSGRSHHGQAAEGRFAALPEGQGLAAGVTVTVPAAEDLCPQPLFQVICRFRLDEVRDLPQVIVQKDKEYQVRVDWAKEGGQVSFFVYLDGQWEPRVRGPVATAGTWYDVSATWDGAETSIEVNGERTTCARTGVLAPSANPVVIGPLAGVIDRVELRNPGFLRQQALVRLDAESAAAPAPSGPAAFGGPAGWPGWGATAGATCAVRGGALECQFVTAAGLVASGPLAIAAAESPFVCIETDGAVIGATCVSFVGDGGYGAVPFRPQAPGRTVLVNLATHPAWKGTIRRLALSGSAVVPSALRVERLMASNHLEGRPFLHVRSFAPERAVLRTGRPETLIAAVGNLGGNAQGVRAELVLPAGVSAVGGLGRELAVLPESAFDLISWTIQAERPCTGPVVLRLSVADGQGAEATLPLTFAAPPGLPLTGYVPEPLPAQTDYLGLMHYCALWKEGTHYGWGRIEAWPERRPAIGFYDEGTAEVADWHIKYALEHGISGFIYCWYRRDLKPEISQLLGHAIHEGLYEARYRDRFRFCIMWENGCAEGVKDADDLLTNLFPFWMKNYFTHPSYFRVDNTPVLFVWRPEKVGPQLGGTEGTRQAFEAMRQQARAAGFKGLRLIGCIDRANPLLQQRLAAEGWDATSGYALMPAGERQAGTDVEGVPFTDHATVLALSRQEWEARRAAGPLPDVPNVMMGWDPRPWHGTGTASYRANPQPASFEAACRDAKVLVDQAPAEAWYRRLVVFDNWTEFGEGHYIEPTVGTGFAYVNAIKRVFCTGWAPEAVTDIIPEDVGLEPPQRRYLATRELYGGLPWRPRVIRDHLIAAWSFDQDDPALLRDTSASAFHLVRREAALAPGHSGTALVCGQGWGSFPAHAAFFPSTGITVSLWCQPATPGQSDHWMLNTVGSASDGYRLGLGSGGKPVWQVPRELWSHGLTGPEVLPVGAWSHVAATFDNRVMRLYVNGTLVGEMARPGLVKASRGDLFLGTFGGEKARFEGLLDEVRLYDRPLAAAEIADLARQP
jgi:hypothetical protein